jgi:hypothetical protein
MPDHTDARSGYQVIHDNLMQRLAASSLGEKARRLNLRRRSPGDIEVVFLGQTYLAGAHGIRTLDGERAPLITASVIAGYLLTGGWGEPAGRFVPLQTLSGTAGSHTGFQKSALAAPLVKRFRGRMDALQRTARKLGGRLEGQAGAGGISLVFDVLSKIPLQLVFYDSDAEFPAEVNFLLDITATNFLEYEYLAVMLTAFVKALLAADE